MTKHTAGPWEVRGEGDRFSVIQSETLKAITGWGNVRQSENDARLIAAAPELLQALEETVEWMENASFDYSDGTVAHGVDQGEYYGWKGHKELVEKMKNAIAKAKGES